MEHDVWADGVHCRVDVEMQMSELFKELAVPCGACWRICAGDRTGRPNIWISSLNVESITIPLLGGDSPLRVVGRGSNISTSICKLSEACERLGFYILEFDGLFIDKLLDDNLGEGI